MSRYSRWSVYERNATIDILKGIAILLVVGAHASMPFSQEISLFHMPAFFMATGFLFSERYSDNWRGVLEFIVRRLKTLYFPFCIVNSVFVIFHNFFLDINFLTDNVLFLDAVYGNRFGLHAYRSAHETLIALRDVWIFSDEYIFGGATWFLRALFCVSILFVITDYVLKKICKKVMVGRSMAAIFYMIIGVYLTNNDCVLPISIRSMFSNYALLVLGIIMKTIVSRIKEQHSVIHIVLAFASSFLLHEMVGHGTVDTCLGKHSSILFLIVASILGWIFLYSTSYLINTYCSSVSKVFEYMGCHSIFILFGHFLAFKVITFFEVIISGEPSYMLAAFPTLYTNNGLWLLYVIVGVTIPLAVYAIANTLKGADNDHSGGRQKSL